MDFLYLNEAQMIKAGVCDVEKCNETMEDMFCLLHKGDYRLAGNDNSNHGIRVFWPKESDIQNMPLASPGRWFSAMPAYLGGNYHMIGIKCYGANQKNPKKGLPRSILMLTLMDAETGAPIAYMSANILSAMRTGSVSGICAKYLAPANPKKIAIIGPGTMARYSLDSIMLEFPSLTELSVLGRSRKGLDRFKKHCTDQGYQYTIYKECMDVREACNNADIILTANSQTDCFEDYPCITAADVKKNAFIMDISAVRIDRKLINDESKCICVADFGKFYEEERGIDSKPSAMEATKTVTYKDALHERLEASETVYEMSNIVENSSFIRDQNKIYICASSGIPTEDVAWGCICYKNAKSKNVGTILQLWDTPQV